MSIFGISPRGIRAFVNGARNKTLFGFDLPVGADAARVDQAVSDAIANRFRTNRNPARAAATNPQLPQLPEAEPGVDAVAESADYAAGFTFELIVPGAHYNGISNQGLLEVLARQGRDFAADTPKLREHVRHALVAAFQHQEWDDDTAGQIAQDAILAWIVDRIESQGVDIPLAPLTPDWSAWKAHKGYDSRIGVAKGKWLKAVQRGRVVVDFNK